MDTTPKPEEFTPSSREIPLDGREHFTKRMEEFDRIKKDTKIIWKLRKTFEKLNIGKIEFIDHVWHATNMHKKTLSNLKD